MDWDSQVERRLRAEFCRASFWEFLQYCFIGRNERLREVLVPRVTKPICDWLQQHSLEWLDWRRRNLKPHRIKYLMLVIPRNCGKTTIATRAWPLWLQIQDPELSTFIGSENLKKAIHFFKPLRNVLAGKDPNSRFAETYGSWYDPEREWSAEELVHAARQGSARTDPSIGVWGVESGLTGHHPDVLILDDPTSYDKIASITNWLGYVNDHVSGLTPVLNAAGMMVFVGTRYHDGDHIGRAMRVEGLASITGMQPPEGYEPKDTGRWHLYFLAARDNKGEPTVPEIWSDQRMKDYERTDNLHYWAQLMNDPGSSEFTPLTRGQVEELWVDKKDVPNNLRYTMHLDTAFKRKGRQRKGDESVIQIWGHARDGSGDVYYIEGYGSHIWRMEQYLRQVAMILQRYEQQGKRIAAITDEREMGGHEGSWEMALMAACHSADVILPKVYLLTRGDQKKEHRLIEGASYWAEGYVRLTRGAPGVQQLVNQMTRIGQSDHDDWADAASDVFYSEIYQCLRRTGMDHQPPPPRRPGDDVLQGPPTVQQIQDAAVKVYDAFFRQRDNERPYQVVGHDD